MPSGTNEWSIEYAQIPRPFVLDDRIRIYYATRFYDKKNMPISHCSFIDVDKYDLSKILYVHDRPSIDLGSHDSFSRHGIHPTMLVQKGGELFFYYQGWERKDKYPYETAIGLAISKDNGLTFEKFSENPVLQKSIEDPYFVNGAFILHHENGYKMFYSGGIEWIENKGNLESVYVIKTADSSDLMHWKKKDKRIINQLFDIECQNTPAVIEIKNKFHMWFSYRQALDFRNASRGYRIGYACSDNLIDWHRDDSLAGVDVSSTDTWDSQMICYPYVFKVDERILMLYCGNYFGKTGFGYAELEVQ